MSYQRWQPCALCRTPTQYAVAGNRLLSRWDIQHLPAVGIPALSWRCEQHRRYKLRAPSIVWATADGDLCFMLACGHQTHQVCRDRWAYTSALVERGVDTGHINLERRRRCYACADVEREGERQP